MFTRIKRHFNIEVTAADQTFPESFEMDKSVTTLKGILLTSDRDDLLYFRGSQKIELSKGEIFPEGYESKLLMSGINVSPNSKYYEFPEPLPVGNGTIEVKFKDTDAANTTFEPYRVTVYLDCIC